MATAFKQVKNGSKSVLASSITNVATSLTVTTGHGARFPATASGPFWATIWDKSTYPDPRDDSNAEIVLVTTRSSDTFTVVRGQLSTFGFAHASGRAIEQLLLDQHFVDFGTAINAVEDGKVTGPASSTDNAVARFDTTTGKLIQNSDVTLSDTGSLSASLGGGVAYNVTTDGFNTGYAMNLSAGEDITLNPGASQPVFVTSDIEMTGTNKNISLKGITTEPSSPAAGNIKLYSKSIAGRMSLKTVGPSGIDTPLQNAFWGNSICMWTPTAATAGVWQGTAGAGAGTYSTALPTTTSFYTSMKRGRWANVVTTTNQVLGQRNTEAMFFRGNAAGQGGFFFFARLGFDVWTNGSRFFGGMHTGTTVVSADPSALNNTVGFCVDAADNGAISFLTRGTAATKASTGMTITSGKGYDVYIFCAPNSSQYTWRIVDINTGTEASGTATANLPTNTTMQTASVLASNGALTTATATQLSLNRIYVETDR